MSKHGNNNQSGGGQNVPEEHDGYRLLKRFFAMLAAFALWGVSSYFSEQGFAFKIPAFWWVGAILAVAIIIIEAVWNEEGMSHGITLIVAGIFAYAYGIGTNILGILAAQGITTIAGADTSTVTLSIGLAVMLEIIPEALFTWAVTGVRGRDFLSNIIPERQHRGSRHGGGNNNNQNQQQPAPTQPPHSHGGPP